MKATITQPEQLAALAIKKAPYAAAKLTSGLTLLVYKQAKGTHWGMYSAHGKKKIAPAQVTDGGEGLNFSDASALAKKLHAEEQATGVSATVTETSGLDPETMTFGEAWDLYLKWASATKNLKALTTILSHHKATSGIHGMKVKGTPLKVLKGWAEQQLGLVCGSGKQKTSGSVGKNITQMKAALNHVAAEYDVDLTGGWSRYKVAVEDCPRLTPDVLDDLRGQLGPALYAREMLNQFSVSGFSPVDLHAARAAAHTDDIGIDLDVLMGAA